MPIDDWNSASMACDSLVAELLLRLKHSREEWTPTTSPASASSSAFRWGARKLRSRPAVSRFVMKRSDYKDRATRSPTTPLSWSGGGTSVSASANGGDGYEASSMMCYRSTSSRSKITSANDLASSKRAKRKKTYNDLKDEEGLLMQERLNLTRDLTTMPMNFKDQSVANDNLKRVKIDSNVQPRNISYPVAPENTFASYIGSHSTLSYSQGFHSAFPLFYSSHEFPLPTFRTPESTPAAKEERESFVLPDLNMMPSMDEDYYY